MPTTERSLERGEAAATDEAESARRAGKPGEAVAGGAQDAAAAVRQAANEIATRLPEATATTRGAMEDAARMMEASSDEMLTAATTLSLGLAIGLLVGGANRLLVALALVPAALMGMTLLDRRSEDRATGGGPATGLS